MRISRSNHRWHVIADDLVLHDCLEALALQQGYRVASVSHELGITEQHFRRIFQRDVGIPVKEWMKWERMVVARRMLQWGIDMMGVSDALGFGHANSFRREFSDVYGTTVTRFLKECEMRRSQLDSFYGNVS